MTWNKLVELCPLEPIKSDLQLDEATNVLAQLRVNDRAPEEELYFQLLAIIVNAYEEGYEDEEASVSPAPRLGHATHSGSHR